MSIRGNTPRECFETFRAHVANLVVGTLPTDAIVLCPAIKGDERKRVLPLGPAKQRSVALPSSVHGRINVYFSQNLETVAEKDGRFRLRTQTYNYGLFDREPNATDEPLFRWEYVADPGPEGKWCRSHFHVGVGLAPREPINVTIGKAQADLHHLHIPTGFVLVEHVIRFLVNDLGVPGKDGWEAKLRDSEDKFFAEFSSKTSAP
jgi:hypothetical protein